MVKQQIFNSHSVRTLNIIARLEIPRLPTPARRHRVAMLLCLLAACNASPAPKMIGATRSETLVEGRSFVVYRKDTLAEVVRLGWATMADRQGMQLRMVAAAEQATGCKANLNSVEGDDGDIRLRLRCPKGV